jgi:predicted TIM-barrel fold metal-dependent hydrolase
MLIADAQIHLWAADTPDRPWPPGGAARAHQPYPVSKDMALAGMKEAGVDRAIIVPPSWEGERNDLALEAARRHPDRFAVMGRFPLEQRESRSLVGGWRRQPGMLGMRFTFHRPFLRPLLAEGKIDWLWPEAEKAGLPIMVLLKHADMPLLDKVAERHPGLRIVIDHLGLTGGKDEEAFKEFDMMLALAKRPNVAAKATCTPHYTTDKYPFRKLHPYLRKVYDAFGPKRMFWGSDVSRLPCSYREGVTYMSEEIPWLSASDKEWIMGRGVCEWLGWKV